MLDQRAKAARGQARRELGHLPAGSLRCARRAAISDGVPPARRPERRAITDRSRVDTDEGQFGHAKRLAVEDFLAAQHDAEFGVHSDLHPVQRAAACHGPAPGARCRHYPQGVPPAHGRRAARFQGEADEQPRWPEQPGRGRRFGSARRLHGPAAVVPFGAPGPLSVTPAQVTLALLSVTPAGRDQQRGPARFGAKHLRGPFPFAPVLPRPPGPAEPPLHFPFLRWFP